ncbi:MAG TPA: rhodanese-like domain-containing protein [Candidatus Atopostipes pullistercoris]|uniref:Rhodanese-like domain-containing protein n=1 Tax=Candidatus Atopostipes pullistercoris TaxID=2838467 RepID=A0A9D2JWQ4_9LACT|nr:rhodanese-like domain-containing protein [Candidatus Atopostipes pullistercoris]
MGEAVSVDELAVKMEDENVRLLDVREADEFAIMHIRKAHNFPLSGFPESMTRLDKHKEYYVIDASGDRSDKACGYLVEAGFYAVKVEGGMEAWQAKNK